MPISAQSQDPKTLDRMQLELYNHFELYGTSVQERSDLLKVLTHEQASLQGIKYASAKGLKSFVEKDKLSILYQFCIQFAYFVYILCTKLIQNKL